MAILLEAGGWHDGGVGKSILTGKTFRYGRGSHPM